MLPGKEKREREREREREGANADQVHDQPDRWTAAGRRLEKVADQLKRRACRLAGTLAHSASTGQDSESEAPTEAPRASTATVLKRRENRFLTVPLFEDFKTTRTGTRSLAHSLTHMLARHYRLRLPCVLILAKLPPPTRTLHTHTHTLCGPAVFFFFSGSSSSIESLSASASEPVSQSVSQ